MKKISSILLLMLVAISLLALGACKSGDGQTNDITNGTWGLYLTMNDSIIGLVYDFRGTPGSGDVYYKNAKRGTFTVTGETFVSFTVSHYDEEGGEHVYEYSGSFKDFYHMDGSYTITLPSGEVLKGGTWTAQR